MTASKSVSPVFKIMPTTQKYDWGKVGSESKVAQYASSSKLPDFELDQSSPYAELWMGTHSTSPSRLLDSNQTLSDYLAAHPELIGKRVNDRFQSSDGTLPFLFKVLTIEKALSLQTHPDKKTAEKLHAEKPDIYKDANHKPEMALALTPFRALCGFMPLPQIATYFHSTPEFSALIPELIRKTFLSISPSPNPTGHTAKAALRDVFSALMTADETQVKEQLQKLVKRYEAGEAKDDEKSVLELVLRLNSQFPGDIGIFCAFMLNYIHLQPGEAIFLGAGEPHAYVSGDAMECMANSDNVIRAGLTPKLRDIPNLVSGLTYDCSPPSKHVVDPKPYPANSSAGSNSSSTLYDPPVPEFSVVRVNLRSEQTDTHPAIGGPSIAIVTEGGGFVEWGGKSSREESKLEVGTGSVFFIGAETEVKFTAGGSMVLYRAFVEVD